MSRDLAGSISERIFLEGPKYGPGRKFGPNSLFYISIDRYMEIEFIQFSAEL